MNMRESKILRTIKEGKTAVSAKLNFSDPRGVELAAMCGFDAVWIDMEHVPNGFHDVEEAVRAAKNFDCDIITRVAKGCYSDYIRPLEADSAAIMIPHLMSLEEAKKIVYYTKFHPVGRRPLDGGNADGGYCMVDVFDYMKAANEQRITIVQIEDPEPIDELEEICRLPGIDMLFFGPADFSQGIKKPCDFSNPEISECRKRIADTVHRNGKYCGTTGSAENFEEYKELGYNLINIISDVTTLGEGYKSALALINR